jgi:hypothetical protein
MEMFLFLFHFIVSFFTSTDGTPTKLSVGLVTESSKLNVDSSGSKAFDGSSTTQWVSGACRTGGWKSNKEINLLTDICANGLCSASCDADKLTSSNDQSVYTAATIPISHSEGRSWVRYDFPSGFVEDITSIYIRGSWAVNTSLFGILSSGELTELIVLNQDSTYQDVNLPGPFPTISGLYLQASSKDGIMTGYCYSGVGDCQTFTVTEIAVQKVPCFEELTVDLGSYRLLSRFSAQYSGFVQGTVSTSIDGLTFLPRITLDPPPAASSQTAEYEFPSQAMGRYLKFRYFSSHLFVADSAVDFLPHLSSLGCGIECLSERSPCMAKIILSHPQFSPTTVLITDSKMSLLANVNVIKAFRVLIVPFLSVIQPVFPARENVWAVSVSVK